MERADEVLAAREIDTGLAAERRVHHRQQARGNDDERDAAMPGRRQESGEISRHAAAKRHDDRVPPGSERQQPVLEPCLGLARLGSLAGRKRDERRDRTATFEPSYEAAGMEARHPRVGHDGP